MVHTLASIRGALSGSGSYDSKMITVSTYANFPGAICSCCSWEMQHSGCDFYWWIVATHILPILLICFGLITVLVLAKRTHKITAKVYDIAVTVVDFIQGACVAILNALVWLYRPFDILTIKHSVMDTMNTASNLVLADSTKTKCHKHQKHFELWINYDVLAGFFMLGASPEKRIQCIKHLWTYLDSLGQDGYVKFIQCLTLSLDSSDTNPVSFIHLGHASLVELMEIDEALLQSEDYKCNNKIEEIIQKNLNTFIECTNVDELLLIMENKQLLTCYDIEELEKYTHKKKAKFIFTELLRTKGHRGYIIFLECLDEEKQHIGHREIVKKINASFKDCKMYRPQKYVLREMQMWLKPRGILSTREYFQDLENFMFLCQNNSRSKLDCEIQQYILKHKGVPEAEAVGLLVKALRFKFENKVRQLNETKIKVEQQINLIKHCVNRKIILGNWYILLSCWNRHEGRYDKAKEYLGKAKEEMFSLASGDDRGNIFYNEASLLIEQNDKLRGSEEEDVITLLQEAIRCFHSTSDKMSIMLIRCHLKKVHCHIGSSLVNTCVARRKVHLKKACLILNLLEKQSDCFPLRLQMHYHIVQCDYHRATNKSSKAIEFVRKGLKLDHGNKFGRDQQYLKARL